MNWALAAGSLAAVLALAGIAWALGLGGARRIGDEAQAMRLAEEAVAGFAAREAVVCDHGGGAAVFGEDGRIALIRPSGARFVIREVRRPKWQATERGIDIDGGDHIRVQLALECAHARGLGERLDAAADTGVSMSRA